MYLYRIYFPGYFFLVIKHQFFVFSFLFASIRSALFFVSGCLGLWFVILDAWLSVVSDLCGLGISAPVVHICIWRHVRGCLASFVSHPGGCYCFTANLALSLAPSVGAHVTGQWL